MGGFPVLVLAFGLSVGFTLGRKPEPRRSERVVLVTGAAGFIGFHAAKQLAEGWGVERVVGIDSFNEYYDVQLKKDRASYLLRIGVEVYRGDVCDGEVLQHLFAKYNFTDVVHMAAQAGVRYSLEDPQAYVSANYECFISLLDSIQKYPAYLVYASSSSVYGKRATVPFSSEEPLKAPGNLYAASKIMNEHLASAYCSQHDLHSIGLRFFTVYGPWGRPDMAAYKFAECIVTGMPVPLFEAGPGEQLKRDFTYIDDIVSGVLSALERTPERCGEAYNLGFGEPLIVEDMLHYLEKELATTAVIDRQPLPPSDMILTFADITISRNVLGFSPKTPTAEGIHRFVKWFRDYYEDRVQWEKKGRSSSRNARLEQSLAEREKEVSAARLQRTADNNSLYRKGLAALRQRYEDAASEAGVLLPVLEKKGFILHSGKTSPGSTVIKAPGLQRNRQKLEARCLATEQCVAFTSEGEFKTSVLPPEQWSDSTLDLYVADVDMCAADLHRCGPHSVCHSSGPGTYDCGCEDGYLRLGRACVERYRESTPSASQQDWLLADLIDGVDWPALVEDREFVFFPGMDSPGGDYLIVGEGLEVEKACRRTPHCLAYNTNGILKHSLQPPQQWVQWTDTSGHGLYVLDIDYCQMGLEQCPAHSQCDRSAPGNFSCQCVPPYQSSGAGGCEMPSTQEISLILSLDKHHLDGVPALLHSLWQHTSKADQLRVYIVAVDMSSTAVLSYLKCHQISSLSVEVMELASAAVSPLRRVVDSPDTVGNLASAANFARFMLPHLFPQLHYAVYLDTDTLVLGDVAEVWSHLISSNKMMVAVPRSSVPYGGLFSSQVKELFQRRYKKTFSDSEPSFNAGLWGMNFDIWRRQQLHVEVEYWTEQHAQQALWRFGTQPILLLVAHGQWDHLPLEWNVDGLGWNTFIPQQTLNSAKLLHWSGRGKPWQSDGLYHELWTPHLPSACSGHGRCTQKEDNGEWVCTCEQGYTAPLCTMT
ncbi:UDP-glucuronate 4-epimerase 4 [Geodia barretti]|uniref:UDP-glucuronate 4-epimerase 4 n=1 Tax=Geodia barretti TaxID=519541 RepID=A0AA35X778_GEOBA|nr:UDP-glucuronate 4-epimerase 4 [Geodia barretti]